MRSTFVEIVFFFVFVCCVFFSQFSNQDVLCEVVNTHKIILLHKCIDIELNLEYLYSISIHVRCYVEGKFAP
jgi:hypothetical protein